MAVIGATMLNLLDSFAVPLGGGALNVRFERHDRDRTIAGTYIATLELRAVRPVTIDMLAVEHADNVEQFIRDFVKEKLEPWRNTLIRAGSKAIDVWQDELG